MNTSKKARLERSGWAVVNAAQFLNLNPQEAQFVELKLALAAGVRQLREQRGMTQAALAEQLRSSQSRVAKMEAADRSPQPPNRRLRSSPNDDDPRPRSRE